MSFAVLRPQVKAYVRDGSGVLLDPDYDALIRDAVSRYSRAKPRLVVADLIGPGGFDYPLPDDWSDEWSELRSVEYPVGEREPVYVDRLDRVLYRSPDGMVLRFKAVTPRAGELIRLTFTGLHSIAEGFTTIPPGDHDVVTLLASALGCEQLASHYTNAGDTSLQLDTVDHRSKGSEYAHRAKRFRDLAREQLPALPEEGQVSAAGGETSWGDFASLLTHPHR